MNDKERYRLIAAFIKRNADRACWLCRPTLEFSSESSGYSGFVKRGGGGGLT